MKMLTVAALVVAVLPAGAQTPAPKAPPASDLTTLQRKCEVQWKDDYRMRAYCETQQKNALAALKKRSMVSPEQRGIRTKCTEKWPGDFRMMNYCEEQQLKALASLGR